MADHPIQPDESGDVPRCVARVYLATRPSGEVVQTYFDDIDSHDAEWCERNGFVVTEYARRRRCDGCENFRRPEEPVYPSYCVLDVGRERDADDVCKRWEAKRDG